MTMTMTMTMTHSEKSIMRKGSMNQWTGTTLQDHCSTRHVGQGEDGDAYSVLRSGLEEVEDKCWSVRPGDVGERRVTSPLKEHCKRTAEIVQCTMQVETWNEKH